MQITETSLEGVLILVPARHGDTRGYFSETWNKKTLSSHGIEIDFVQDNQSLSAEKHTLRGLHFQAPPAAQDKLVRTLAGSILDVAVDARKGSPTYGKWVAEELSAENGRQLLVPKGFLHGFLTLTEDTLVAYKCSDYYCAECDGGVRFDDPTIGVDWGIDPARAITSEKDGTAQSFADFVSPFVYKGEGS